MNGGRLEEGNDDRPKPAQKSDLSIGAKRPSKVGRAKGEMG